MMLEQRIPPFSLWGFSVFLWSKLEGVASVQNVCESARYKWNVIWFDLIHEQRRDSKYVYFFRVMLKLETERRRFGRPGREPTFQGMSGLVRHGVDDAGCGGGIYEVSHWQMDDWRPRWLKRFEIDQLTECAQQKKGKGCTRDASQQWLVIASDAKDPCVQTSRPLWCQQQLTSLWWGRMCVTKPVYIEEKKKNNPKNLCGI